VAGLARFRPVRQSPNRLGRSPKNSTQPDLRLIVNTVRYWPRCVNALVPGYRARASVRYRSRSGQYPGRPTYRYRRWKWDESQGDTYLPAQVLTDPEFTTTDVAMLVGRASWSTTRAASTQVASVLATYRKLRERGLPGGRAAPTGVTARLGPVPPEPTGSDQPCPLLVMQTRVGRPHEYAGRRSRGVPMTDRTGSASLNGDAPSGVVLVNVMLVRHTRRPTHPNGLEAPNRLAMLAAQEGVRWPRALGPRTTITAGRHRPEKAKLTGSCPG